MISDSAKGYVYVMAAAVFWASSGVAGKSLFESGITPSDLVQIRVTFASALIAGFFACTDRSLFRITMKDVPFMAFLGGALMALVQLTYFYTISKIQVMAAILLQYLSPLLVALFSMLFWRESCTVRKVAALFAALLGCWCVVGGYNLELFRMNSEGIRSGVASAACYAAYALLGEKAMRKYRPWTVVFYSLFFAAITWHLIHPPFKYLWAGYTCSQLSWLAYITAFGTAVPFGLYFAGINHIRATKAMITASLEPIAAGIFAFVFLGERLEPLQILGAALTLFAVVLLQGRADDDPLSPETLRSGPPGNCAP